MVSSNDTAAFDFTTGFGTFTNNGLAHNLGDTLVIGAAEGFTGAGVVGTSVTGSL